eukprot:3316966-Pleurochrysis_carterae.AAC.1
MPLTPLSYAYHQCAVSTLTPLRRPVRSRKTPGQSDLLVRTAAARLYVSVNPRPQQMATSTASRTRVFCWERGGGGHGVPETRPVRLADETHACSVSKQRCEPNLL